MPEPQIPRLEFEIHDRSAISALFQRHESELTYQESNDRAVRRLIRRLADYDADTFKTESGHPGE